MTRTTINSLTIIFLMKLIQKVVTQTDQKVKSDIYSITTHVTKKFKWIDRKFVSLYAKLVEKRTFSSHAIESVSGCLLFILSS